MTNPFSPEFLDTLAKNEAKEKTPAKENPQAKGSAKSEVSQKPATDTKPAEGGVKDGIHEVKDSAGQVVQKIPFSQGKMHGTMEVLNPKTQALTHKMSYVNGVLHGDVLVYSPIDQTVAQRIPFVEGKKRDRHILLSRCKNVRNLF
ncbi:MAG: hypothetical protein H6925_05165 [Holosporaceae bacterium]|nr:MAG: hypothetical protein H6925_05165 [Holosporaceae bacterium]